MSAYHDSETHCPECGCKGAMTTLIPEHKRAWMDHGECTEVVEHMPESKDRVCNNCDHRWTDYPEGTR